MNETTDPPRDGPGVLLRLVAVEATTNRIAEALSAHIQSVETLAQRYYTLAHRLGVLERALASRDAPGC